MQHKIKISRFAAVLCAAAFVAACGGGGGSSAPPPAGVTPPSALSYPAAPALVVGQAMAPLTPSVSGTVTSYAVAPALPAGLSLSATTGVISGTPSAVTSATAHTVTATNSGGSTTAAVSLTVNDIAPSVDYATDNFLFTTGVSFTPITPTVTGGAPVAWTIHPALPDGLIFGASDGSITGTPTAPTQSQSYLVTATNSGGQSQASLTIAVESGVLLELGHAAAVDFLQLTATRALSQDRDGHWVLWNLATTAIIAQGETPCLTKACNAGHNPVGLAGSTVVIGTATGLEIRAAGDGHVLGNIVSGISSWELPSDGTYIVTANATGLQAWTPSGTALFTRAGDYSRAIAFATPSEIRVVRGPAGDNVIEEVAVPSGTATVSGTFLGTFASWFLDGERFLTTVGTTVRVYSQALVQEDFVVLPTTVDLAGQGAWFWITHNGTVQLFAVGASATPTATYTYDHTTKAIGSGTQLAIVPGTVARVRLVNLAAGIPTSTEYPVPHGALSTFGANAAGRWLLSNRAGVLLDGATLAGAVRYFGYGAALSIAGSDTRVAIATASGRIPYFNAATKAREGTLEFDAAQIALTSDGSLLAARATDAYAQYVPDRSLRVYALPSATLLQSRLYTHGPSAPFLVDMSLARSGEFIAETLHDPTTDTDTRQVTPIAGGPPTFSDTVADDETRSFTVSPDGSLVAITTQATWTTHIYRNGSLVGAAEGAVSAWLDDERLLLNRYGGTIVGEYLGATVTDEFGAVLGTPPLPHVTGVQPLGSDLIYSWSTQNSIFSVVTGELIWKGSRLADRGAVAGPRVIFTSGSQVRAEPH